MIPTYLKVPSIWTPRSLSVSQSSTPRRRTNGRPGALPNNDDVDDVESLTTSRIEISLLVSAGAQGFTCEFHLIWSRQDKSVSLQGF